MPAIRRQIIFDGSGKRLIHPQTEVAAIVDMAAALDSYTDAFVQPRINFTQSFSTAEAATGGVWIDASPIYRRTFSLGLLPKAGNTLTAAHGISSLGTILNMHCFAVSGTNFLQVTPAAANSLSSNASVYVNGSNIILTANMDLSSFKGYLCLLYTKGV